MSVRQINQNDSFTLLFNAFIEAYSSLLSSSLTTALASFTNIDADDLVDMLTHKYYYQDINVTPDYKELSDINKTAVINDYIAYMVQIAKSKAPYYNELIANYNKAYDYSINNKKVVSREDHYTRGGTTEVEGTNTGQHVDYDLPNKNVNPDTYRNNPSELSTDDVESSNTTTIDHTSDGTSDIVTTYNNEFLDLKRKYLNQIRNVYEEFADEFKECFYIIYPSGYICEEDI